mgnify:CR=1 FL=1
MDALLAIVQMPPGIPVATVGVNASLNAAILAVEMLSLADAELAERIAGEEMVRGVTISCGGVFGPQGRRLRVPLHRVREVR